MFDKLTNQLMFRKQNNRFEDKIEDTLHLEWPSGDCSWIADLSNDDEKRLCPSYETYKFCQRGRKIVKCKLAGDTFSFWPGGSGFY